MVAPLAVEARNPNLGSFETNGRAPHRLAKRPLQSALDGWTVQHSMAGPLFSAAPMNFATDRFARGAAFGIISSLVHSRIPFRQPATRLTPYAIRGRTLLPAPEAAMPFAT